MTQQMERAEVLFGKSLPPITLSGRPKVARQAARQTLAAVVDLDQRLLAMVATRRLVIIRPLPSSAAHPSAGASAISLIGNIFRSAIFCSKGEVNTKLRVHSNRTPRAWCIFDPSFRHRHCRLRPF
jgi:hypothetical protein